jgi:hypothetical protein
MHAQAPGRLHRPLLGGALVLLATALFSIQDGVIKLLGDQYLCPGVFTCSASREAPICGVALLPAMAAIGGVVFFALLSLQSRRMSSTESSELMVFWGAVTFVVVGGATLPGLWRPPSPVDLGLMLTLGAVAGAALVVVSGVFVLARPGRPGA